MMRLFLMFLGFFLCENVFAVGQANYSFFVSATGGSDDWDGRDSIHGFGHTGPVRSLNKVRELVRQFRGEHPDLKVPVYVFLAKGTYRLSDPFVLEAEDSGTSDSPTVYRDSGGPVVLSGGITVSPVSPSYQGSSCGPCRKFPKIMRFLLPAPILAVSGHLTENYDLLPRSSLFFHNKRMPLARWPNHGFISVEDVDGDSQTQFKSAADNIPAGISSEPNLWAKGYWKWDWFDSDKSVKAVGSADGSVSFFSPESNFGVAKGGRFYFYNALSALNTPGEWYLDERSGMIYFWPPSSEGDLSIDWPILNNVVVANNVSNIEFMGISFSLSRGDIVSLKGVSHVLFNDCHFLDGNLNGITLDGVDSGVASSEFEELGRQGIHISGGDRQVLAPSRNFIRSSKIHDFGQLKHCYEPAVYLAGVGAIVSGNEIYNAPHLAILISGNNHLVERNHIFNVLTETSDAGAIYLGRNWSERGNVIRFNYFSDINASGEKDVYMVYLDDEEGGVSVYGNVFWNAPRGVFINGGSDNVVTGNYYVNSTPSVIMNARGMAPVRHMDDNNSNGVLQRRLAEVPYNSNAQWIKQYKGLQQIKADGFGVPHRNVLGDNYIFGGSTDPYSISMLPWVLSYQSVDKPKILPALKGSASGLAPSYVDMCKTLLAVKPNAQLCH